mgnify:CR=1 FL=1
MALSGCFSPQTTRSPDVRRGQLPREHASSQRQGFELHDPLPSEDLGPFTDTRPRAYNQTRTMPRRAMENYFAPELGGYNNGVTPAAPPAGFSDTGDPN